MPLGRNEQRPRLGQGKRILTTEAPSLSYNLAMYSSPQSKPTGDSTVRIIPAGPNATIDQSKRDFLRAALALLAGLNLPKTTLAGGGRHGVGGSGQRVVMVVFGGVRRAETFSPQGLVNIPHLSGDLLSQSLFYREPATKA